MNRAAGRSERRGGRLRVRAAGTVAVGVAAAAALLPRVVRRVVVEGESMRPTLEPGDRLLVVRTRRPLVGDLVAAPDPRAPGRLLVKRVAARSGGLLELRGDNPSASTDSRDFGHLPPSAVWGRVVRRYAPAGRAGIVC